MSPSAAIHSPVFLAYLVTTTLLLLGAGLVLDVLRRGTGARMSTAPGAPTEAGW